MKTPQVRSSDLSWVGTFSPESLAPVKTAQFSLGSLSKLHRGRAGTSFSDELD